MSTGGDSNAVGSSKMIDGQVWYVVAIYPIKISYGGAVTGSK